MNYFFLLTIEYCILFQNKLAENPECADLLQHFPFLLSVLYFLKAIGGESPRMIMESTADVLFALSKNNVELLRGWFQEVVNKDGYPSERCSKADKEQFVKSVLR